MLSLGDAGNMEVFWVIVTVVPTLALGNAAWKHIHGVAALPQPVSVSLRRLSTVPSHHHHALSWPV
jgi:hypothetical protein